MSLTGTDGEAPSVSDEFLGAAAASDLRCIQVSLGIDRHVVQEDELTRVATDPTELTYLLQRTSIEDVNSTIPGIRHIEVLLLDVL